MIRKCKRRDFTDREFARALDRNGFTWQFLWLEDQESGHRYGMVIGKLGEFKRRESLARAIQKRWAREAHHEGDIQ